MYTSQCCGMIALKREVAARVAGFPWSECQVRKLATSHCNTVIVGTAPQIKDCMYRT